MSARLDIDSRYRLTRTWRRRVVVVGLVALLGVAVPEFVPAPPRLLLALSIVLGTIGIVCLWLLVDALWPWLIESVGEESRSEAAAAVQHSYSVLSLLAIMAALYLIVGERSELEAFVSGRARPMLWCLTTLVLLLPPAFLAWSGGPRVGTWIEVGPATLVHVRLQGKSGRLHGAAALTFIGALPLLIVGPTDSSGGRDLWWIGAVVLAMLSIVGCAGMLAWTLLRETGDDGSA